MGTRNCFQSVYNRSCFKLNRWVIPSSYNSFNLPFYNNFNKKTALMKKYTINKIKKIIYENDKRKLIKKIIIKLNVNTIFIHLVKSNLTFVFNFLKNHITFINPSLCINFYFTISVVLEWFVSWFGFFRSSTKRNNLNG